MKLEVTELGPNKRALKIEVPEEEVNRQFAQAYVELNRQVRIPGFRPGKAPLGLLEQRYAKAVEEDLIRKLIPDYYDKAVRQAGIVPVLVEVPPLERAKIKKNAPFSFTATVEIKPAIELRDYKAPNPISLKPDKREVTDEQMTQALEALREQQAQLDAAPPGTTIEDGDYAVLDVRGSVDGTPLEGATKEGHLHKVGSKLPVLGVEVDQALLEKKRVRPSRSISPMPPPIRIRSWPEKPWSFECPLKLSKEKNWRRSMTSLRKIAELIPLWRSSRENSAVRWKRP